MKRGICLGTITLLGVLATLVTGEARQDRAKLMVHEIADNLYMLGNDSSVQGMGGGGNTAIFVTADGVTLVDTKISGYGQDILTHVRELTDKPVTTIINTHTHWDHTGTNTEFPDTVDFVVHENTLANMSRRVCDDGAGFEGGSIMNCESFKGENAKYLPKTTYSTRTSLFSGPDQIDLYYFGRGHTDGDTFVVFRAARAMHTGDMFQRKALPFIDVDNTNGSAVEFGSTLMKAVDGISGVDHVIPGHAGAPVMWDDFVNFSGFFNDLIDKAQQGVGAGRTVDQVADAYTKPGQYSDFGAPEATVKTIVQHVYNEQ